MLRNIKAGWISLLEPLRRVMGEYKTLIVKMCKDIAVMEPALISKQTTSRKSAKYNCNLLCDVGTLLALPCVLRC
jgi:hypothetical protein